MYFSRRKINANLILSYLDRSLFASRRAQLHLQNRESQSKSLQAGAECMDQLEGQSETSPCPQQMESNRLSAMDSAYRQADIHRFFVAGRPTSMRADMHTPKDHLYVHPMKLPAP